MSIRVAINGYGRIGRQVLRAIYEQNQTEELVIVAINNAAGTTEDNAYLTRYDTVHGRFPHEVSTDDKHIIIDGKPILYFSERDPAKLPWADLKIDLVFECTGIFTSKAKCQGHLSAGAKKVLISAPGGDDVDATIVYGVNDHVLTSDMTVVSNASCTTNCLAPMALALNDGLGIVKGLMTTIHAATNDQVISDVYHSDPRRARAAMHNMIPTKTGAAAAVGLVLPQLKGRLDGFAVRVPTLNVSLVDLTFEAARDTTVEEVNRIVKEASQGRLKGILAYNTDPLVSSDFNHTPEASTFDAALTKVSNGNMVKVLSWYDNEWGFSVQMLRTAKAMFRG
jgi:glyceraldehyde 3-phosphate dehydrogenase